MAKPIALMDAAVEREIAQVGAAWHLGRAALDLEAFLAAAARPRYNGLAGRTRSRVTRLGALVSTGYPLREVFVLC